MNYINTLKNMEDREKVKLSVAASKIMEVSRVIDEKWRQLGQEKWVPKEVIGSPTTNDSKITVYKNDSDEEIATITFTFERDPMGSFKLEKKDGSEPLLFKNSLKGMEVFAEAVCKLILPSKIPKRPAKEQGKTKGKEGQEPRR
jgi:hypothetical protein